MRSIILGLVCLIVFSSARLLLKSDVKHIFQSENGQNNQAVTTSCKVVDVTQFSSGLVKTQSVYAGYLNVAEGSSSGLAFIFYGSQLAKTPSEISNYSTIIWLNGGPGSSSQTGNFLELGPIRINADGSQTVNPFSWDTQYNVMFVDQPIGTGYSVFANKNEIPTDQVQVGLQFVYAWTQFLVAPTGCVETQKLQGLITSSWFVFGESYAGKYVPTIARTALKSSINFPLRGVGIGDGFTDPLTILKEFPTFGFNMGLIDYQERQLNEKAALGGVLRLKQSDWFGGKDSFGDVIDQIVEGSGGVNVYNIFVFGTYDAMDNQVNLYLNATATKNILGFNPAYDYSLSSGDVYAALSEDFMKSDCIEMVEEILNKGLQVLIYNGQNDLIVPNPGTLKYVYNLKYNSTSEFQSKDYEIWRYKEQVVGYKKNAGNLEFRIVNRAGHLVPMDQPEASLDMVNSFVKAHQ